MYTRQNEAETGNNLKTMPAYNLIACFKHVLASTAKLHAY